MHKLQGMDESSSSNPAPVSISLSTPRAIPWANWTEWDHARRNLFSDDIAKKIIGIEMITLWRIRGRIPHAI